MSQTPPSPPASIRVPEAVHPPAISLRRELPWVLFGLSLLLVIYFVAIDGSAASVARGELVHEWLHDGRHLLGFACD
jgi:hypothetical protein